MVGSLSMLFRQSLGRNSCDLFNTLVLTRKVQEAGLEPASRVATDFKSVVYTISPLLLKIVLLGLEPRQREPKSLVLPLHYKTESRGEGI